MPFFGSYFTLTVRSTCPLPRPARASRPGRRLPPEGPKIQGGRSPRRSRVSSGQKTKRRKGGRRKVSAACQKAPSVSGARNNGIRCRGRHSPGYAARVLCPVAAQARRAPGPVKRPLRVIDVPRPGRSGSLRVHCVWISLQPCSIGHDRPHGGHGGTGYFGGRFLPVVILAKMR
jgi:hypothetical protein